MTSAYADIEAPMCGYADDIAALIATVQAQDANPLARLQARVELMNTRFGTDLSIYEIDGRYGYQYHRTSGSARSFADIWRWLNGVQVGLEIKP